MTQEEKELLLKDLCARFPYKIIVKTVGENKTLGLWDIRDVDNLPLPYLRPMSSMTEKEENEYHNLCKYTLEVIPDIEDSYIYTYYDTVESIDWLNAHHFDYRGLIEKGLALEAPKDMYSTKTE